MATTRDLRYVALGDSYTIGTSVAARERYPNQLVARLAGAKPHGLRLVANLGVDGYTSADLIRDELPVLAGLRPQFATLLIGVNDVVQEVPIGTYGSNVTVILDSLLKQLDLRRLVIIGIPDYTVTPSGTRYGDPARRRDAIVAANAVSARLARERAIAFVDVFAVSRETPGDGGWVADDGLHPSGTQYARWVAQLEPVVRGLLAG